jgi:hypothetical protein
MVHGTMASCRAAVGRSQPVEHTAGRDCTPVVVAVVTSRRPVAMLAESPGRSGKVETGCSRWRRVPRRSHPPRSRDNRRRGR